MTANKILEIIKRRLIPKGGVKERAVKSGIWVTLINIFDRGLQLVKVIILARLLSPAEIGLIGIALLAVAVFEQFSRFGIDEAIIQQEEDDVDEYLNTAWIINISRGILIVGIAYLTAPYIAMFFSEPRSANLIRVIALSSLLTGLRNPGLIYFRKNLDFHKQFGYTLTGSAVSAVVTIATVWVFRSVWAFVFGRIAGNITMLILSYGIHRYRPFPEFDKNLADELIGYGKWILGSGVILFLVSQGDDAFVGWFLSASALGFYQLGYRMSNAPSTEITNVVSRVAFPAYSQVQTDIERLRDGYFRTLQLTMMISLPMAAGIIVTAPVFVRGFFGEQWLPMVIPMQILAVEGAFRSLAASAGPLFKAIGRPDYDTKLHILRFAIIVPLIYPLTAQWGLSGTALVIVGSGAVVNPLACYLAVRESEGRAFHLVQIVMYPLLGSVIMALIVWFVLTNATIGPPWLEFCVLVSLGVVVYVITMAGIDRQFGIGLEKMLRAIIGSMQ